MTKVLVFDTLAEAKKDLEQFLYQNRQVSAGIKIECAARQQVYKNSADFKKLHASPDEILTAPEKKIVFAPAVKGKIFTSLLKFYIQGITNNFAFDCYFDDWDRFFHCGGCGSITSLVDAVHENVLEQNTSIYGIKTFPLFYTVREGFKYSKTEIGRIKEVEKFKLMSAVEQRHFSQGLRAYTERGLTDAEICEFVTGYNRFLN